ncbi:hypothetical protein ACEQ8H_006930 [Pleosporales sp. CAS-2024a]
MFTAPQRCVPNGDSDAWSVSSRRSSIPLRSSSRHDSVMTVNVESLGELLPSSPWAPDSPGMMSATKHHHAATTTTTTTVIVKTDVEAWGQAPPEIWTPTRNEWLIMISLAFISLMVALDATILVTVLPVIARDLNGTSVEAFWAGTSYLLTSAIFQPVIASLSELFGRQQLLVVSLLLFTAGTILCSVAHGFAMLLPGRCVQGVGGGGIITLTQVIFCDIVPLRQRPKYFPLVLGSWSIGSILGPLIGGLLTEKASWRWCFDINYPFCGIGLVVAVVFVRLNRVAPLGFAQKLKQTDWIGIFIFVGAMTSFLMGLSWGGVQYAWDSATTLAPIIVGAVAMVVFFAWQCFAPHSLLPMSIFYNSSAIAAFYCALINGLVLFTALYYLPFYLMAVRGQMPAKAGLGLMPAVCLLLPGSIVVSVLTSRLGRFRWAIWCGWAVTTGACGLWLLFEIHTSKAVLYTALALFGIGAGMVLTSVNVGIQAISRPQDCAMAASMYGFFRSLGMPIGVTLAGTIFQNAMSTHLTASGLSTDIAHDSEQWVHLLRTMPDGPHKTAILESYMKGFHYVFLMMTGASASALLVSFVIRKFSMDKVLATRFTARA